MGLLCVASSAGPTVKTKSSLQGSRSWRTINESNSRAYTYSIACCYEYSPHTQRLAHSEHGSGRHGNSLELTTHVESAPAGRVHRLYGHTQAIAQAFSCANWSSAKIYHDLSRDCPTECTAVVLTCDSLLCHVHRCDCRSWAAAAALPRARLSVPTGIFVSVRVRHSSKTVGECCDSRCLSVHKNTC